MKKLKTGKLAVRTGCQVETIRFQEKERLLPHPQRSAGNHRLYGGAHVDRLTFVRHCRSLDMTLDKILYYGSRMRRIESAAKSMHCSEYLERFMKSIYSSCEYFIKQRPDSALLAYEKFSARPRKLKEDSFGAILVTDPNHPDLYTYRGKMLRGYVRMQAEAHHVELAGDKIDQPVRHTMRIPTSARRGYYTSSPPPDIHFGRDRRRNEEDDPVKGR